MWHAARKQEKMIRVMMVDYQKRAGRRREFYERIKLDPNQFLRVYGRPTKIHLDPSVAMAAEGPQIMQPWQGNPEVTIDRYDVRSHIDSLPSQVQVESANTIELNEESRCNYERYRILVQNDCAGVTEDECLKQIYLDEQFGSLEAITAAKLEEDKKKKSSDKKAAIGYTYDTNNSIATDSKINETVPTNPVPKTAAEIMKEFDLDLDSSDEDIDLDNILDIDMLNEEQEQILNQISVDYGMLGDNYSEFLQVDRDEVEAMRMIRQIEEEKAQYSGRKSRRERRAYKDKNMKYRHHGLPSYAARDSTPKKDKYRRGSSSRSRSRSPAAQGVVQFITSFGGNKSEDEGGKGVIHGPSLPPHLINFENFAEDKRADTDSSSFKKKTIGSLKTNSKHERSRKTDYILKNFSSSSSYTSSSSGRSRSNSRSHRRKSRSRSKHCTNVRQSRSRYSRSNSDASNRRSSNRSRNNRRSRSRSRSPNNDYRFSSRKSKTYVYSSRESRSKSRNMRNRSSSREKKYKSDKYSSNYSYSLKKSVPSLKSNLPTSSSNIRTSIASSSRSPPLRSYRRPSLSSSNSGLDDDDDDDLSDESFQGNVAKKKKLPTFNRFDQSNLVRPGGKVAVETSKYGLTPQERLKRKMQIALNKQYKADKRAQVEKQNKDEQIKLDREEELRVLSLQLRQRDREKRHREREELENLEQQHEQERIKKEKNRSETTSGRNGKSSTTKKRSKSQSISSKSSRSKSTSKRRNKDDRYTSSNRSKSPKHRNRKLVDY